VFVSRRLAETFSRLPARQEVCDFCFGEACRSYPPRRRGACAETTRGPAGTSACARSNVISELSFGVRLDPAYRDYRLSLGRLALADRTDPLRRLELHRHGLYGNVQRGGQPLPDIIPIVLEFRALQNHRGIHVHQLEALLAQQVASVGQKVEAVGFLPARIRVWKVHADI